ncbi:MAG: CYTH domain-containing protein [Lachnospiraceae bacterium]|nr:CYTH domain-containing protein [Lachnospiraceae bacterium]
MEIERKFIPPEVPSLAGFSSKKIEQAYISTSPTIRIRKSDDEYYLTVKGKGHMAREELNIPMKKEEYEKLLKKTEGRVIKKTRYIIPLEGSDGLNVELDIFEGDLKGLVLAEVEFPTKEAAESFVPPAWLGRDVTGDKRYHNSQMSKADYKLPGRPL